MGTTYRRDLSAAVGEKLGRREVFPLADSAGTRWPSRRCRTASSVFGFVRRQVHHWETHYVSGGAGTWVET